MGRWSPWWTPPWWPANKRRKGRNPFPSRFSILVSLGVGLQSGFRGNTTRKVAMADEVEVAPWLLVYHGRRFLVSPLCMSKRFFSFLRPPSPTKTAKTSRMVARDVVHLEFSGSPAESTQIRTAEGCRAQMAASLALFFFSIAPSRSTFSDRAVYDAGSWVPHVILYEPKFFLFLDFF